MKLRAFSPDSLDLVKEDLGRRPGDSGVVGVDSVDEERSASGDVVDRVVDNLLDTGALDNDVEAVCLSARHHFPQPHRHTRVVLLDLGPLGVGVLSLEVNVRIGRVDLSRNVHLDTLVGGDGDVSGSAHLASARVGKRD